MAQTFLNLPAEVDRDALHALVRHVAPSLLSAVDWSAPPDVFQSAFLKAIDAGDDDGALAAALNDVGQFSDETARRAMTSAVETDDDLRKEYREIDDPVAAAINVFIKRPDVFQRILAAAEVDANIYSRSWAGFRLTAKPENPLSLELPSDMLEEFAKDVQALLKEADAKAKSTATWFERRPRDIRTGKRRIVLQTVVYIEKRAEVTMKFDKSGNISREPRRPVTAATLIYDVDTHEIDVVVKGGKPIQEEVVRIFLKRAFNTALSFCRIERRLLRLDPLRCAETVPLEPGDVFEAVKLVHATFASKTSDGFLLSLKCGRDSEIWSGSRRHLANYDPVANRSWVVTHAELRFTLKPTARGGRKKIIKVSLIAPNKNNLHNLKEPEAALIISLLERWGVFSNEP